MSHENHFFSNGRKFLPHNIITPSNNYLPVSENNNFIHYMYFNSIDTIILTIIGGERVQPIGSTSCYNLRGAPKSHDREFPLNYIGKDLMVVKLCKL